MIQYDEISFLMLTLSINHDIHPKLVILLTLIKFIYYIIKYMGSSYI